MATKFEGEKLDEAIYRVLGEAENLAGREVESDPLAPGALYRATKAILTGALEQLDGWFEEAYGPEEVAADMVSARSAVRRMGR